MVKFSMGEVFRMDKLKKIIVTDITEVLMISSPKGRFEKIHNRGCYGVSFCIDGQITYTHNGKKFVSDNKHAIILPQGQSYTLYGDKKGLFPVINFTCQEPLCDTFMVLPVQDNESFIMDCDQMKALFLFDGNHSKIMSIFYNMLHRLSSYGAIGNTLTTAIKYIESNYQNPALTNQMLANECKISEVYLRKLFVEQLQTTPKQFILDIRMQKAKQLLTEGVLKISTIADHCGVSNPYHFCRLFKQKTGITPTEYAKQNRVYKI